MVVGTPLSEQRGEVFPSEGGGPAASSRPDAGGTRGSRIVRVLIDEPGLNKAFDYVVPAGLAGAELVAPGTIVRVPLHGRRAGGWIVAVDVEPAAAPDKLKRVAKITGLGPPEVLLRLSKWAAWRWWGRPAHFLRTASPETAVRRLPNVKPVDPAMLPVTVVLDDASAMARNALRENPHGASLLRIPPTADTFSVVLETVRVGGPAGTLVLAPSIGAAVHVARRLRRAGVPTALLPDEWAVAAAGGVVAVGTRAAAWAPLAAPGAVVVLDEHDLRYKEERAPSWNARDVALERARLGRIPCLLVSPTPSPEAVAVSTCIQQPSRSYERGGWPQIEVIDRSDDDPAKQGLLSGRLGTVVRSGLTVVAILNRTGRAKLLACGSCGDLSRCEACAGAMAQDNDRQVLRCQRCGKQRPTLCLSCGSASVRTIRMGVTRAREELEALAGQAVAELTAGGPPPPDDVRIVVGTEAALHRLPRADVVVFLDFDSHLFLPRVSAAQQALQLLVLAARLVGGRSERAADRGTASGRILVQTRVPEHPVLLTAIRADPTILLAAQASVVDSLGEVAGTAFAEIRGPGSDTVIGSLEALGEASVSVRGQPGGPYLVSAPTTAMLCTTLARVERPAERVRVEVDPVR